MRARSPPAGCAAARCTRRAPLRRVLRRAHRPPPARADEKVSSELKTNIMKARLEKKMTQAQLAQVRPCCDAATRASAWHRNRARSRAASRASQAINELPKIVQDYEAGKAIPNQAVRWLARPFTLQPAPPRTRGHTCKCSAHAVGVAACV